MLVLVQELFEVHFNVLEDQVELLFSWLVDNLLQSNDVGVRL